MNVSMYGLCLCMGECAGATVTFNSLLNNDLLPQENLHFIWIYWMITPLQQPLPDTITDFNVSDNWTAWGAPHNKTVFYKNWPAYNLGARLTLVTQFHRTKNAKHRTIRILKLNWVLIRDIQVWLNVSRTPAQGIWDYQHFHQLFLHHSWSYWFIGSKISDPCHHKT